MKEQAELAKSGQKPKEKKLETRPMEDKQVIVHLVPHSHTDPGWTKTFDEYYSGADVGTQHAGIRNILDTVVDELDKNPERKFCYAEMSFLEFWWNR